ncbi:PAS domain S-box-containing protein [Duganella sp. SG902]|uniref:ATP-binding protein n=1 Tax=Duganella sp. SG902 TaxID=2587016 RepID=UPI00159E5693|nr:ATP-binding protein [Duganella sp. SG902]NVM79237.1 PAS domain S-box-containing protein [Duganella sp. SG902]
MQFEEFDSLSTSAAAPPPAAHAASPLVRLQYLVDNTPAIIYCTVPSGDFKMTFVSNNAYNVLGYRPEQMVADPNFWFDHIHPEDAPNIFSSLALVFTEGQRAYEYRFRIHDGSYLWMHDTLRLIRDEHGAPLEVIGSLTDITERKRMEEDLQAKGVEQQKLIAELRNAHEQLLQSEKMASIGQLAAGIAHEINNPVGFVNSNMGSLQKYVGTLLGVIEQYEQAAAPHPPLAAKLAALREQADLEFLKEDVTDLVRESMDGLKRVKDIVQALKDFSHVGETEWQVADLHRGLDSTLNIVSNEIKYKARVDKQYGVLPPVTCLASQLNQVFMNLLVNAAHAMREQGVITIRTGLEAGPGGPRDHWVWVEIGDNGVGIAPENLNRIFEPFFTTKPVGSGTGLGLSLSYGIVNRHGGRIEVASELGQGTRFTVHLPVKPPGAAPAQA